MKRNILLSSVVGAVMLVAMTVVSSMAFAAPRPVAQMPRYVAMGDSVAAGSGLPDGNEECDRSSGAYSVTVAAALTMDETNLACSGAKVDEGIYGEQTRRGRTVPQQLSRAFENGTPQLITLTIGANDMRWVQLITQCYVVTCGNAQDTSMVATSLATFSVELDYVLRRVSQQSGEHPPTVLLSGYYDPTLDAGCVPSHLSAYEIVWLSEQTAALNQVIRSVAERYPFAAYAPVDFTGHGFCAAEPWIKQADERGRFHPNQAGQQALARAVIAAYEQVVAARPSQMQLLREKVFGWLGQKVDSF